MQCKNTFLSVSRESRLQHVGAHSSPFLPKISPLNTKLEPRFFRELPSVISSRAIRNDVAVS